MITFLYRALIRNRWVISGKKLIAGIFRYLILCAGRLWRLENDRDYSGRKKIIMRGKQVSGRAMLVLCLASFLAGSLFCASRMTWTTQPSSDPNKEAHQFPIISNQLKKLEASVKQDCDHKRKLVEGKSEDVIMGEVTKTHQAILSLDKTISRLETELAAARANQRLDGQVKLDGASNKASPPKQKAFVVIGINTAFSSKKRRKTVRETWMPKGGELKKLEEEKGIVIRFVIGQSAKPGGMLDRAIEAEEAEHKDFLRLNHVEGYHELSTKTRLYFSTAISIWDADFYVKVDDDVHVNLGMLVSALASHRSKPRIYIGCMKSGPVLFHKGVKYHEPEYWKFGEEGNKYFRHATGQIYAISKDLAAYISINLPILHRYANEDVSLGAWLIGLEVEHVDDRSMCCGTPTECERRAEAGNVCVASFDWKCSGICDSVERMKDVHNLCGEGNGAVWNINL
ncbi:PREDICTED: beta-1 [Prunus dulcis]|uniref:Hexosyltransferase n=1 Tax=Prunus dulcis TaxID=3755 RepID=A0A5E4FGF8_PRUDU|nr:probable beta-1,3-galactosyltransferase 8 [Prunus dulcis]VVA24708.1 PREDICTED: beta-1 [Prunus dulcis]